MFCRTCDYNLASLPAGRCPECATAFDPSDPRITLAHPWQRETRWHIAVGLGTAAATGTDAWLGVLGGAPFVLVLLVIAAGALGLVAVLVAIRLRLSAPSRAVTLLAMLPASCVLVLFASLAMHMRRSLGGWPSTIGTRGFPPALASHAQLASGAFSLLVLACVVILPAAVVLGCLVRRLRCGIPAMSASALSVVLGFGAMLLAPAAFLSWWWD